MDDGEEPDELAETSRQMFLGLRLYLAFLLVGLVGYIVFRIVTAPPPVAPYESPPTTPTVTIPPNADIYPRGAVPLGSPASWIRSDDYPNGAIREGKTGVSGIRYRIGRDGRVSECSVIQSSGSALLDNTACGLLEERGRYLPARNDSGAAVAQMMTIRFRWQIPE